MDMQKGLYVFLVTAAGFIAGQVFLAIILHVVSEETQTLLISVFRRGGKSSAALPIERVPVEHDRDGWMTVVA